MQEKGLTVGNTRAEFERLLEESLSAREASRACGIAPSTGIAWAKKWKERKTGGTLPEGPVGVDEEKVANLLLSKAEALLIELPHLEHTRSRLEQAKAIEALLGKYLSFTGKATEQHVTIDGSSSAELDKFLAQLLPAGDKSET